MKVAIAVVAHKHWYEQGVQRMREQFAANSPGYEITCWTTPPLGAREEVIENGVDYSAYCWKPFALRHALQEGADVAILLDAAFWPIRPIQPLVDYIETTGYFLCDNGATLGQWCSDRALERIGMSREEAFAICEPSSYCVGISRHPTDFGSTRHLRMLNDWCDLARLQGFFEGPHTAGVAGEPDKRNPGWVSDDPRVLGHRHDQTGLAVAAWWHGCVEMVKRPRFTAYDGSQDERTVLVNRGI